MLNLGQLQFTLGVNTRPLDDARKAVESFGRAASASQAAANRGLDSNVAQYRKIENAVLKATEQFNTFAAKVARADLSPKVRTELIEQAEKAYTSLTQKIADTSKLGDMTNLDRGVAKFNNSVNGLGRSLDDATKEQKDLNKAAAKLDGARAVEKQSAALAKFDQHLRSQGVAWKQNTGNIKSAKDSMAVFAAAEKNAAATAREVAAAQKQIAREAASAERAAISQGKAFSGAMERAKNLSNSIDLAGLSRGSSENLLAGVQAQVNKLKTALSGPEPLKPKEFAAATQSYNEGLGKIRREFARIKSVEKANSLDPEAWRKLKSQLQAAGSTMLFVNGHLGGMSTRMLALGTLVKELNIGLAAATAAVAGLGLAMFSLGKGALATELKMEKARKALTAITGSAAAAEVEMGFLRDVADQTGQVFSETTKGYTRFYAASVAAGQTAAETQRQFRGAALAAGTLGLSAEDTNGVFRAFEQILSKGTVQAEELRGQLGDRLPGAFAIAAQSMGVTTRQLSEMTKKGELASRDFLPKFIDTLLKVYNIQADKPIDTLQAALNRATNAMEIFFDQMNRNTELVNLAKNVVNLFARTLNFLADNMSQIVRVTSQVAGAIAGAIAAFVALQAVIIAIAVGSKLLAWMGAFIALARTAKTVTDLWALATMALNTAMMANPIGAVIGLITRLVVVIGGAIFGYKQMTAYLNDNSAALDSGLDNIQDYIDHQKAMGYQVAATTAKIKEQAEALAATAGLEYLDALTKYEKAKKGGTTAGDVLKSVGSANIAGRGHGAFRTPADFRKGRIKDLADDLREAEVRAERARMAIQGLNEVSKLPEFGFDAPAFDDGDKGSSKKLKDEADKIRDLMQAYKDLAAARSALSEGPEGIEIARALSEAQATIEELTDKQLGMLDTALTEAGYSTGTLVERLAKMNVEVAKGEDSVAAFISAWDAIDDVNDAMEDLIAKQVALSEGAGTRELEWIDNLREAKDMIKDMAGPEIDALLGRLQSMGTTLKEGATPAEQLAWALAQMFQSLDDGQVAVDAMDDFNRSIRDLDAEANEALIALDGLQQGLTGSDLDAWVESQMAIQEWTRVLTEAGWTADEVAAAIERLRAAQANNDAAKEATEAAQRVADFKEGIANAVGDFAADVLTDFNSIWDAAKNLLKRIQQMIIESFIVEPLVNSVKNLLGSINFGWGGFSEGGYTGNGPRNKTAGVVHGQEYVFSADAVKRIGVSNLEAMHEGRIPTFSKPDNGASRRGEGIRGGDTYINVRTPDANSFTRSRRQVKRKYREG